MDDLGHDWTTLTPAQKEACRVIAFESLEGFTRVMFRFALHEQFLVNWHHAEIFGVCEDAYFGRSKRDIVNVSPGGTKTITVAVMFPAWAIFREYELARSIRLKTKRKSSRYTRWLSISYSDDLVTRNSGMVLELTRSAPFQFMCPNVVEQGAAADWKIRDAEGGGHNMYGVSLLGQVTGNRAGYMREGFSGAELIDDPMPPRDERSFAKKDQINRTLNRVTRNRLAHDATPIVMIQQRVTTGDQTDFLRSSRSLDDYRLTKIPALITSDIAKRMPPARRKRMVDSTGFDGRTPISFWESQVSTDFLLRTRENDAFLFSAQYQQAPDEAMLEGTIFRKEMEELVKSGRNTRLLGLKPHIPVNTWWDLGINDDMSVILGQEVGLERWVLGALIDNNVGLEHYLVKMMDWQAANPWVRWGKHYGPHDLKNRGKFTAKSDKAVAFEAGLKFEPAVDRPQHKRDAIEATRRIFPLIRIDENACKADPVAPDPKQEDRWLWAALRTYHRVYDAENEVFKNEPAHDWASNPVDGFMLMGLTYTKPDLREPQTPEPVGSFWGR